MILNALQKNWATELLEHELCSDFHKVLCIGVRDKSEKYLEGQCASLFSPKNSFQIHLAKIENFKTEKFSDKKSVSVAQRQSLLVRNYFQFLVQQRFSKSNLRQLSD